MGGERSRILAVVPAECQCREQKTPGEPGCSRDGAAAGLFKRGGDMTARRPRPMVRGPGSGVRGPGSGASRCRERRAGPLLRRLTPHPCRSDASRDRVASVGARSQPASLLPRSRRLLGELGAGLGAHRALRQLAPLSAWERREPRSRRGRGGAVATRVAATGGIRESFGPRCATAASRAMHALRLHRPKERARPVERALWCGDGRPQHGAILRLFPRTDLVSCAHIHVGVDGSCSLQVSISRCPVAKPADSWWRRKRANAVTIDLQPPIRLNLLPKAYKVSSLLVA